MVIHAAWLAASHGLAGMALLLQTQGDRLPCDHLASPPCLDAWPRTSRRKHEPIKQLPQVCHDKRHARPSCGTWAGRVG